MHFEFLLLVFFLTSSILLSSTSIFAKEKIELTLEECIRKALEMNADLKLGSISVQIAERQVEAAAKQRYPKIELSNFFGLAPRARGDAFSYENDINDYSNQGAYYQYSLKLKQPLYSFGKISGIKKASEMRLNEERAKGQKKREEIVFKIKALYYDLLLTEELIKLSEDVKSNFEKAVDKAEEKLNSDKPDITQQDVLKLKLGLVGTKDDLNSLEHTRKSLIDSLQYKLGIPPDKEFDIKTKKLKQEKIELKKINDYFDLTFSNKSTLKEKEASLNYEEALLKSVKSRYFPEFFIRTGVEGGVAPNRDNQHNPFVRDDYNYFKADIALGMKWSLDFSLNSSRVHIAEAKLRKARVEKEMLIFSLPNKIKKTYLKIKETEESVKIARKARKVSRSLLVINLANFDFGIGEAKDLFESLFIYMRSVNNYLRKVYDYNIAVARLSLETGNEITKLVY